MTAFVKNTWYVAAMAEECCDTPISRMILGERVVLFRLPDGRGAALEDRCCHRLAPLSMGDIEPDGIRCRYHGMKFAPSGRCIEIPGQDEIGPQMGVRHYPLVERHGLLWIWMGEPERADDSLIVDCHWHTDPDWPTTQGYIHYQARFQLIADNLLDFSHLTYVHRTTLGNSGFPDARPQIEPFERGIRLTREMRDIEPSPLHRMAGRFEGRVDFWNRQVWWLPSVFENWAGSVAAGGEGPAHEREGGFHLRHFSLLTPETEDTTHYFWIQPCRFPVPDPDLIHQVKRGIDTAFEEDRLIIEAQQRVMKESPLARPMGIQADKALNMVRFMNERWLRREAAERKAASDSPLPTGERA
jgi:phenylpropionate dioxygenase-like ring-hydroxylating dioxygenase large terminal subunit